MAGRRRAKLRSFGLVIVWTLIAHLSPPLASRGLGPGRITGTVVDGSTGKPLSGATVKLVPDQDKWCEPCIDRIGGPPNVLTDASGRFEFDDVEPDAYQIKAAKPGYPPGAFGVRRTTGDPARVGLDADEQLTGLTIMLFRRAVIQGTVRDEAGAPIVGIAVSLLRRVPDTDRFPTEYGDNADEGGWQADDSPYTDDQGHYVAQVPAGEYVAAIRFPYDASPLTWAGNSLPPPRTGSAGAYRSTYFPGVASPKAAKAIVVRPGDERNQVNFTLKPIPGVIVSGRMVFPPTVTFGSLTLKDTFSGDERTVRVETGGAFTFSMVPPGRYTLESEVSNTINVGSRVPEATAVFRMPLVVGGSAVTGLVAELKPGATTRGSVIAEGMTGSERDKTVVYLTRADDEYGCLRALAIHGLRLVIKDGRFASSRVMPGRYRVCAWGPKQAVPALVTMAGRNVSDQPLEIGSPDVYDIQVLIPARPTNVTGRVFDQAQSPAREGWVLLFPSDPQFWADAPPVSARFVATRISVHGTFDVTGLAAGDYMIVAVPDDQMDAWPDRRMLERAAAQGGRIHLETGGSVTQDLAIGWR